MERKPVSELCIYVPDHLILKVMEELSERNPFLECAGRTVPGLRYAYITRSENFKSIWNVIEHLGFKPTKVFLEELLPCSYADHDSEYFKWNISRIHIPIVTNESAKYLWGKSEMNLKVGRLYAVDPFIPFRLSNEGFSGRLHLVIDIDADDWKI